MKRILTVVAIAIALSFNTSFAAPTVLKVAIGNPPESEQGIAGQTFKKYVEANSEGKYEVQLFFSGQLGDETETIHNVLHAL